MLDFVPHQPSAMIAAHVATEATVSLLRFHREGPESAWPFGDPEPVHQLAEALLRTVRIEHDLYPLESRINNPVLSAEYLSGLGQLAAACSKFLEDHCDVIVPEVA